MCFKGAFCLQLQGSNQSCWKSGWLCRRGKTGHTKVLNQNHEYKKEVRVANREQWQQYALNRENTLGQRNRNYSNFSTKSAACPASPTSTLKMKATCSSKNGTDDAAAPLNSNSVLQEHLNKGCCYLKKHANFINTDKQIFSKVLEYGKFKKTKKYFYVEMLDTIL